MSEQQSVTKEAIEITKERCGSFFTYSFRNVPQEHLRVRCGSQAFNTEADEEALKLARKLNPHYDYKIVSHPSVRY